MNLRQMLLALRVRWWVVLAMLTASMAAAVGYLMVTKPSYVARTQLIIELKTDPLVSPLAPVLGTAGYLATQAEILQSERLAGRVVRMMGLPEMPEAVERWRMATDSKIPIETFYAAMLSNGLRVETSRIGSQIIALEFTAEDSNFAATAVNAFARAYIELGVELRADPARDNAAFLDQRLKALRTDLESAQNKVASFQKARGVVISNERYDQEMSRLASLEASYAASLADQAGTSSIARNSSETSADVSQNAAVVAARTALAAAEGRLAEASLTLGTNHPQRIELESRVKELREQLSREIRLASGTSASTNRVASARLGELRGLVEAQKRTIVNMRAVRDEGALLIKELEAAQRAYDAVNQRRSELSLESKSDAAGARVLTPAVAPLYPEKPKRSMVLAAAALMGLLAGIGAALGLEMLDRRVRSADDLAMAEGIPVLAVLSSKPISGTRRIGTGHDRMLPPPKESTPRLTMSEGT